MTTNALLKKLARERSDALSIPYTQALSEIEAWRHDQVDMMDNGATASDRHDRDAALIAVDMEPPQARPGLDFVNQPYPAPINGSLHPSVVVTYIRLLEEMEGWVLGNSGPGVNNFCLYAEPGVMDYGDHFHPIGYASALTQAELDAVSPGGKMLATDSSRLLVTTAPFGDVEIVVFSPAVALSIDDLPFRYGGDIPEITSLPSGVIEVTHTSTQGTAKSWSEYAVKREGRSNKEFVVAIAELANSLSSQWLLPA